MKKLANLTSDKKYIKYGLLIVLFIISMAFCLIPNNGKASTENKKTAEDLYTIAFDKLINGNYNYTYKEYNKKKSVLKIYTGSLINDENVGYYESNKEVFKYTCREDKCYKSYTDHDEEFEFKYSNYLRPSYIYQIINDLDVTLKDDGDSKIYVYTNDDRSLQIKVTLVSDNITNIIINDSSVEYNLSYN